MNQGVQYVALLRETLDGCLRHGCEEEQFLRLYTTFVSCVICGLKRMC